MTFAQARDVIIDKLSHHLRIPIILSGQSTDMPAFPYGYYSVLSSRISNHAFGLREVVDSKREKLITRSEPVKATLSLNFCSHDRETTEEYILGEDEALKITEKANGFFLLNGHNITLPNGSIVINDVGAVANRSSFFVDNSIRRYGFDVKFAYIRTDEAPTTIIESVKKLNGKTQS